MAEPPGVTAEQLRLFDPPLASMGGAAPIIEGRTYLERGRPVVVLVRWRPGKPAGPRNVTIRRESGEVVVRPFRGLRKPR